MVFVLYKEKNMKKKISKRTYITGAILVLLILSIAASVFFSKYNVSREIKNVRAMRAGLSKLASSLESTHVSEWKNKSGCRIANAGQFGSRDHYFCEARYESKSMQLEANQAVDFLDRDVTKLAELSVVEAVEKGGRYIDSDEQVQPYVLRLKGVSVNRGTCNIIYYHSQRALHGEMYCIQEVSKPAYDELTKD